MAKATIAVAWAHVSHSRTSPIPRIITTPSIPGTTIPACIAIIPGVEPGIKPGIVPSCIIAITPWIVPTPVRTAPVVWSAAVITIEPRIVKSVPTAQVSGAVEIITHATHVLLGKSLVIVDGIGSHALAHSERYDVVAQRVGSDVLIMAQQFTATVVFIHISVASRPVEGIYAVLTCTLGSQQLCLLHTFLGCLLGFLLRVEVEVIILCHHCQWQGSHKD